MKRIWGEALLSSRRNPLQPDSDCWKACQPLAATQLIFTELFWLRMILLFRLPSKSSAPSLAMAGPDSRALPRPWDLLEEDSAHLAVAWICPEETCVGLRSHSLVVGLQVLFWALPAFLLGSGLKAFSCWVSSCHYGFSTFSFFSLGVFIQTLTEKYWKVTEI